MAPSLAEAERGFCGTCGSNLFWRPASGRPYLRSGCSLRCAEIERWLQRIFVGDKGDYYSLMTWLPQHHDGDHGVTLLKVTFFVPRSGETS